MLKKKEYCTNNGIMKYAGSHLIVEIWGSKNVSSIPKVRKVLKDAIKACDATLLFIHLHKFTPFGGISGVAVIEESHVSIHSWPEYDYAALDIFMCGDANPYKAIPVFKQGFKPKDMQVMEIKRGLL